MALCVMISNSIDYVSKPIFLWKFLQGDHSQPHMWPPWFGKPVSVLFLTECELTFGREIETVHHGDYRGSLKLSLVPG